MCGIVGYIGKKGAANIILSGLKRLEYRGYDSAGIALLPHLATHTTQIKAPGKIIDLEAEINRSTDPQLLETAGLGIGHTRWATHGAPTGANAHPHTSSTGRITIVHNGIIDNYAALKGKLQSAGYTFSSETDSEVLANLIDKCYDGDLRKAVATALAKIEGTFGIAVIAPESPDQLVIARRGSPIAIGVGEHETVVASDVSAIISVTNKVIFLDDDDIATITADTLDISSLHNVPVNREAMSIDWDIEEIEKGGYDHFMLKEIFEQPKAIGDAIRGRLQADVGTAKLAGMQMDPKELAAIDRICVAACGTSLYAGMVGKYFFEQFASLPTDVEQAAEFRDRNPIVQRGTCMLAISQSGETADTLAAVREAHRKGATVLGVVNVVGSTIAREAGRGVHLHAGPEIGVASTKAFTCQVSVLAMMAIILGRTRRLSMHEGRKMIAELARLPELAQAVLDRNDQIRAVAKAYADREDFFFIGRNYMYPAALEGALKLKEISYIHAEGYHAAELKHGPLALLNEAVPVVACAPDSPGKEKTVANMQECRARKAPVIAIATEGDESIHEHCDELITIPPCEPFVAAIPVVIAEQLLAYHIANIRGCEIDQPRNLAKSVTVE
jgi:glucosamine--fructose-6-phosphate aminotransferase (isomerizing)